MFDWKKIKTLWKKVKRSTPFIFIFTVSCSAIAALIANYLSSDRGADMTKQYLNSLGAYYSYFTFGVFFLLALLLLCTGYLAAKMRIKTLYENKLDDEKNNLQEIHQAEIDKQNELYQNLELKSENEKKQIQNQHQIEIQSLEEKHQKETGNLNNVHYRQIQERQIQYAHLEKATDAFEATVKQNYWLILLAAKQAESISDYVKLDKFFFHHLVEKPLPKAIFSIYLKNKSVFDVTLDNKIDGFIEFDSQHLLEIKRFSSTPEKICSMTEKSFTIDYRLSKEEYTFIKKYIDSPEKEISVNCYFDASNLVLTIKNTEEFPQVVSRQLTIRNGFKVWSMENYAKDTDEYQQQGN